MSGMRGIFSAVRALEDTCIVPPLVGAIHRRIAGGGAKPGAQDYATPEMLRHLWQRAASKRDRAFVALVILSWICFWRVGELASVHPFDLLEAGGVSFYRTKSGGPRGWHRRPLFKFGMSWADYLSEYSASDRASPSANPSSAGVRRSLRTASPLSSADRGGAIMHGTALGEEAQPPVGTKSQNCPTLNGGGAGLLLGLPCAMRQLSLIMECWRRWPCHDWIGSRGASGGQLPITLGFCYVWGRRGRRVPRLRGVRPWSCSLTPWRCGC